jgi:hypothetical protein
MSECLASIHLCRVRATRLNSNGTPASGPNNVVVSDTPMVLTVTPVIEAGQDRTLIGGCDCIVATYRGYDKLKRFDLELDMGALDFSMLELILGSTAILSGGAGNVIGQWWNQNAFDCSVAAQPNVCFEGWQTGWDEDEQSATHPYVHWIWPSSFWQIAQHTLQNDFTQPKLTGFTRGNSNWGTGIYGDLPEAAEPLGGFFYSSTIPTAFCGYQSRPIT